MKLTLDLILSRCVEEGDCWLWAQGTSSGGQPCARDDGKVVQVRRRVWELANDQELTGRWRIVSRCARIECVSPKCATRLTPKQHMREMNKLGLVNGPAHHAARTAAVRRRATTKLDMQKAAEIRRRAADGEDLDALAEEFGCSKKNVYGIARGERWRPCFAGNSVFNLAA